MGELSYSSRGVNCLTIHENKLYSGSEDDTIKIWAGTNTETYELVATLRGHTEYVNCLAIHENKLYSGSDPSLEHRNLRRNIDCDRAY